MENEYKRLLDKKNEPTKKFIEEYIGERVQLWRKIHNYLNKYYDFKPETVFFTKKYGWTVRYRKSGRTLCYFFPEKDAYSVLIVLGKKEVEKVEANLKELNQKTLKTFQTTEQLHDGRWLWLRIMDESDLSSLKTLIHAKRKPKAKHG